MQIRVFHGVRPGAESAVTSLQDGLTVRVDRQTEGIKIKIKLEDIKDCTFAFDKVVGRCSSQADVFTEVSKTVQSALDGYKVCPSATQIIVKPHIACKPTLKFMTSIVVMYYTHKRVINCWNPVRW